MSIPKIIHQIWIGPHKCPMKFINTFREKNPDFEHILWNEQEIQNRGFKMECVNAFNSAPEWCGRCDILRWELLWNYGGIFLDADSVCLEPFDKWMLEKNGFAAYENETTRAGLVAVGTMGFPPKHPLCRAAIDFILNNDIRNKRSWMTTGPVLLTNLLNTGKYPDFTVFPSFYFIPRHFTGDTYHGHKKVYAFQYWGSTYQNYDTIEQNEVPPEYRDPPLWVSVLISSYNTKIDYVRDCLESIRSQNGHFGIELVWVNDGSDATHTEQLEAEIENFRKSTRFTRTVYHKNTENLGLGPTLKLGVELCTYEIIVKMDSDDIMVPDRIKTQLEFMKTHPDCMMVGSNIHMFRSDPQNQQEKILIGKTNHPEEITMDWFRQNRSDWFMNHPTLMYKKTAVLAVGNYNPTLRFCSEDYDLELRVLKRFGRLYNMPDFLVYYRIHEEQSTYGGKSCTPENVAIREQMKRAILES